ncbi:carboxymuconolactone decarboxylase family protein [Nocardia sp. alder85J]|uniref:carboxymuconolactone decarboxylase family protein n=1 Tax=Nocardia sp. alder85J TaxID=2862949 RepID=UPI001CD1B296|nr:carboxymuconolactone decarboxylase family protein [Nocardia sp. alder85J]MCX4094785.1 carboxymuconolactone decarboxylase family protein [Nocardia sp. alder85J]
MTSADTTRRELWEAGLQVRREVVGSEYVDRALAAADDFQLPMQELVTEYCWGSVWTRPGLDRRTRSMLNLAMLATLNRSSEFATHVRGALTNGVTEEEIREVLLQATIYAGVPAGVEAFRIAGPILAEHRAAAAESGSEAHS